MTNEKEKELEDDIEAFKRDYSAKFRAGDKEHAGTKDDFDQFNELQLLQQALKENLDQYAYIRKAMRMIIKRLSTDSKNSIC